MSRRTLSTVDSVKATLARELLVVWRSPGDIVNPLMFFLIAVSLFPLGGDGDPAYLSGIAAGVVWVTALLAVMLSMPAEGYLPLMLGLLLGTPTLNLIGGIGMALTVGLARSGLLLAVLVLPLSIPVLVFGAGMVQGAMNGLPYSGLLALLGALLVLAMSLVPLAIGAALRISVN